MTEQLVETGEAVEPTISYYTVTLGPLTRAGHARAEIAETSGAGKAEQAGGAGDSPTPALTILEVPAGLPGELVTIAVEAPAKPRPGRRSRRWKQRPPRVWITEIQRASPERVAALCPVFGTCGGCQFQHMRYEAQLEWKRAVVEQLLREIGGFDDVEVLPAVPCAVPWHYRNHMRFSVNRAGEPGLTARGSHRVLPLSECPIADEQINRTLAVLGQHKNKPPQVVVRCGTQSGQVLVQPAPTNEVAEQLAGAGIDLHTETMEEVLAGERFRIRPSSFFQTNTVQAETMVRMVLDGLLDSDRPDTMQPKRAMTVVDAYCGVGTFAVELAQSVEKVIAIEESASAIKDAQWNLRGMENVEILKGKVEDLLPGLAERIDGFVIDPPRAGCQASVLEALVEHPVARIVYVSCDPATQARDLNVLCHVHPVYRLRSIQPLDMFPQTAHIESIAVLERVSS